MTDESKKKREKPIEELDLNKQTIQDLTEREAEQVGGGFMNVNPSQRRFSCTHC